MIHNLDRSNNCNNLSRNEEVKMKHTVKINNSLINEVNLFNVCDVTSYYKNSSRSDYRWFVTYGNVQHTNGNNNNHDNLVL